MNYMVKDFEYRFQNETDEIKRCTKAIQAAIDACAQTGGVVRTEEGRVYPIGGIELKSGVYLYLASGSTLRASKDWNAYKVPVNENGEAEIPAGYCGRPSHVVIYAKDAHNVGVLGEGTIDGISSEFITSSGPYHNTGVYPRPEMIYMEACTNVVFQNFEIKQAPFWTLHVAGCENILIDGVKIHNDLSMANSDGIDPDHCKNVVIRNCEIFCADDAVCLKNTIANSRYGSCENILIENCKLVSTSAGVKIGTEGIDDFRNICVRNCVIEKSNRGISIQIRDKGNVQDVRFENIQIDTRRFQDSWWGKGECIYITSIKRTPEKPAGKINNISFSNITCNSENGIYIFAEEEGDVTNLQFNQLSVEMKKKSRWKAGNYDLRPCWRDGVENKDNTLFYNENGTNIKVIDADFSMPAEEVEGYGAFVFDNTKQVCFTRIQTKKI